jgi:hypothetical protein
MTTFPLPIPDRFSKDIDIFVPGPPVPRDEVEIVFVAAPA